MNDVQSLLDDWLAKNNAAVEEALKYLDKKGNFNPKLEKPWPKWEQLRIEADQAWYKYYTALRKLHEA